MSRPNGSSYGTRDVEPTDARSKRKQELRFTTNPSPPACAQVVSRSGHQPPDQMRYPLSTGYNGFATFPPTGYPLARRARHIECPEECPRDWQPPTGPDCRECDQVPSRRVANDEMFMQPGQQPRNARGNKPVRGRRRPVRYYIWVSISIVVALVTAVPFCGTPPVTP